MNERCAARPSQRCRGSRRSYPSRERVASANGDGFVISARPEVATHVAPTGGGSRSGSVRQLQGRSGASRDRTVPSRYVPLHIAATAMLWSLPWPCVASISRRQSKTRRAARREAGRFSSRQGCPVCRSLRMHRSCGLVIQDKALFFGYLSFVAYDKRK